MPHMVITHTHTQLVCGMCMPHVLVLVVRACNWTLGHEMSRAYGLLEKLRILYYSYSLEMWTFLPKL
jgi:hypothetical protein